MSILHISKLSLLPIYINSYNLIMGKMIKPIISSYLLGLLINTLLLIFINSIITFFTMRLLYQDRFVAGFYQYMLFIKV